MDKKYLIIGTGVAAIAAVESIRSQDIGCEITLVSKDVHGYYSLPGLAYFLANEIPEPNLSPLAEADFQRLNVRRVDGKVTALEPANHRIVLSNGDRLPYDRLLLATGAKAVLPTVPGIGLDGVVTLDSLDDARHIARLCSRVKTAVVVGGGITALELVEGMAERGVDVHYFMRGAHYWGNVLNEIESEIVEDRLKKAGIQIHTGTDLAEIMGKDGKVAGVVTRAGERISCSIVGIAIGVLPRKELAEAAGISTERGILVDEYLGTDCEDIFAAGDVAQVYDPVSKKYTLDTLWWVAREQGRVVGLNMVGKKTAYKKLLSSNMTRLTGINTNIIGSVGQGKDKDLVALARGDSDQWRNLSGSVSIQSGNRENRIRLQLSEKTLTGAVIMGDQSLSYFVRDLIAEEVDITPIRPMLLGTDHSLSEILTRFADQHRGDHAAG